MTEATVRAAYGGVADLYVELFAAEEKVHPDDLAFLRRHLGTVPDPIIDAGCGPGHLTAYLHGLGRSVTGLDLTPEFIAHARATYPQCSFIEGSFDQPGASDPTVGGIVAWYSLIHTTPARIDGVLGGWRARLKPGGVLVLGVVEGPDLEPFPHKVTIAYFWSPDGAADRLERAGFTIVDCERRPAHEQVRPHLALAAAAR